MPRTPTQEAILTTLITCVTTVAKKRYEFTSNEVWEEVIRQGGMPVPVTRHHLVQALKDAVKQGLCERTQWHRRCPPHFSLSPVYRSCVTADRTEFPDKEIERRKRNKKPGSKLVEKPVEAVVPDPDQSGSTIDDLITVKKLEIEHKQKELQLLTELKDRHTSDQKD